MFAQSLDIALADVQATPGTAAPFKTVRFTEGGAERMERAQVLSEKCGQIVLRTLRGNLMSVPRVPLPMPVPRPRRAARRARKAEPG
ncbi:hypothetical protein LP419_22905 [Massilia sp. H-1]|nr:hypothetical protein LP419_22905 [Massilia sp. H-1]